MLIRQIPLNYEVSTGLFTNSIGNEVSGLQIMANPSEFIITIYNNGEQKNLTGITSGSIYLSTREEYPGTYLCTGSGFVADSTDLINGVIGIVLPLTNLNLQNAKLNLGHVQKCVIDIVLDSADGEWSLSQGFPLTADVITAQV